MSAELKSEIEIIDFDLSELSSLELLAKRPNVKTLLTNETNRLTQKKKQLSKQLKELSSNATNSSVDTRTPSAGQPSLGTVVVNNYMWDQTNDFLKIYIEIDKTYPLDSTQIHMNFPNKRSFSVVFGKFKFSISKLFDDIDGQNSYHKMTKSGNKIIFYLKKSSPKEWSSINEVENKFKKAMNEEKADLAAEGADPSAGLMKLMKQMYDEGDDDMKRTIAKSWYESRNKNSDVDIKSDDSLNI